MVSKIADAEARAVIEKIEQLASSQSGRFVTRDTLSTLLTLATANIAVTPTVFSG
jgi:hypothetical protein